MIGIPLADEVLEDCDITIGDLELAQRFFLRKPITTRETEEAFPLYESKEVWVYQQPDDYSWRVVGKQGPKPAGAAFGD